MLLPRYPQQTTVRGSSDPSALHTRHFVRKRSRTGSFDDRNDVTVGGGAVAVSITATQSLHSTPVGKVATTTPQKGRSGRRAEHDALVHSQVRLEQRDDVFANAFFDKLFLKSSSIVFRCSFTVFPLMRTFTAQR